MSEESHISATESLLRSDPKSLKTDDLVSQCKKLHGMLLEAQYMAHIAELGKETLGEAMTSDQREMIEKLAAAANGLEIAMFEMAKQNGAPTFAVWLGLQSRPEAGLIFPGMGSDSEHPKLMKLSTTRNLWRVLWPDDPIPYLVASGQERLEQALDEMAAKKATQYSPDYREQALAPIKRDGSQTRSAPNPPSTPQSTGCLLFIALGFATIAAMWPG